MSRFIIDHGVPYEIVELMEYWEIIANAIVFAKFENGGKTWDWNTMSFLDLDRP